MATYLDLDDVAYDHPVAMQELAELRKTEALLAASEARARELWEALASLFETRWTDANWKDTQFLVDKHAEHFRKESEVTNGSM